jgi:hypothetical protein
VGLVGGSRSLAAYLAPGPSWSLLTRHPEMCNFPLSHAAYGMFYLTMGPEKLEPSDYGLKSLKTLAKINLSSLKLIFSEIWSQ